MGGTRAAPQHVVPGAMVLRLGKMVAQDLVPVNPLEALSPNAVLQLTTPETPTPAQRAMNRGRVTRQVKGCTSCALRGELPDGCGPTSYSGPKEPAFVVVGEAPGPEEARKGKPFVGPSGKLLRALMGKVGIDPDDDVLWANTVSCFPNKGGVIRPPTEGEQAFCRENLLDQVGVGYTRYVLLVGAKAVNAFRSDLQVTRDHGRVFVWVDSYCVMPIIHPAAALRKREFRGPILADLERWCEVVWGGGDPTDFLGETCVKCGASFVMWDRDGVPYCKTHYGPWKNQWEKERRKWVNARIEPLRMF